MNIENLKVSEIKPYAKNAKKHGRAQIDNVAESIRQFGFAQPLVIDKDGVLIIGHCRLLAAKKLGLKEVPCVRMDELTEEQVAKLRLLDNKLNESDWDYELLAEEIEDLDFDGFDLDWEDSQTNDWFETHEKNDTSREDGNDEYNDFLDKFEAKKTTDDCYTPQNIYDVVADWVAKEYDLKKDCFIRPFYPGGDYQSEKYDGKVVVDNPPFSILSEIEEWYNEHNVKYFLFAPNVSNFPSKRKCCAVCVGVTVTYENSAKVSTSFVTNLENYAARTAPDLYKLVDDMNKENTKGKELPNYEYPPNVVTAAMLSYLSKYGQSFKLKHEDSTEKIGMLDAQRESGKGIFGGGFLISEKAAAEKAAAEKAAAEKKQTSVWVLSDREKKIIANLGEKAVLLNE